MTDEHLTDERLARYRSSIDNIDAALVHLLAERFKVTQEVGRYKAAVGLPAADVEREARQVARLRALAEESGLDPVFSEKFLRFIVAEVIHHHQRIAEVPDVAEVADDSADAAPA
jgi:chorismate mutase